MQYCEALIGIEFHISYASLKRIVMQASIAPFLYLSEDPLPDEPHTCIPLIQILHRRLDLMSLDSSIDYQRRTLARLDQQTSATCVPCQDTSLLRPFRFDELVLTPRSP
jgi:hypothetical protein